MKEFECGPKPLIRSTAMEVFLGGFGTYRARGEKVLCRHLGVEKLLFDDQTMYPLQNFFHAIKELREQFGDDMVARMGAQVPERVPLPPHFTSLEVAIPQLNVAYLMYHVPPDPAQIGEFIWEPKSERGGVMHTTAPYPCVFDMGLLRAFISKIPNLHGTSPTLIHEPGECRGKGGDSCHYCIEW